MKTSTKILIAAAAIGILSAECFIASMFLADNEKLTRVFLIVSGVLFICAFMLYPFYKIFKNRRDNATNNNRHHTRSNQIEMNIYTDLAERVI
jgi:flagellar basal body-associated protein FliL